MKVKELKEILQKCNDDDEVYIRQFPSAIANIYNVFKQKTATGDVVMLYSYPTVEDMIKNKQEANRTF